MKCNCSDLEKETFGSSSVLYKFSLQTPESSTSLAHSILKLSLSSRLDLCFIGMDTNSVLSFICQKLPSITQTQEQTQTQTNQSCRSHFLSRLLSEQSNIPVQKDEISSYW